MQNPQCTSEKGPMSCMVGCSLGIAYLVKGEFAISFGVLENNQIGCPLTLQYVKWLEVNPVPM